MATKQKLLQKIRAAKISNLQCLQREEFKHWKAIWILGPRVIKQEAKIQKT